MNKYGYRYQADGETTVKEVKAITKITSEDINKATEFFLETGRTVDFYDTNKQHTHSYR